MSHIEYTPPPGGGDGTEGDGLRKYVYILDEETLVTIVHGLSTEDVVVQCFTTDKRKIEPSTCQIIDDNNVRLIFSIPQSGKCIIIG